MSMLPKRMVMACLKKPKLGKASKQQHENRIRNREKDEIAIATAITAFSYNFALHSNLNYKW